MIGPSSHSNACSLIRAAISPAMPPVRVSRARQHLVRLFPFATIAIVHRQQRAQASTSIETPSSLSRRLRRFERFHSVAP